MVQVTARLPDALGAELDAAAAQLSCCRADIIRQAIEYYLDDIEDLRCGVAALACSGSSCPRARTSPLVSAVIFMAWGRLRANRPSH